jgi:hypothetical protein
MKGFPNWKILWKLTGKVFKYFFNYLNIDNEKKEKEKEENNNQNALNKEDSSKNLTNIEFKNQSMNSSLKTLSHGEEFIQNDVLQVLNNPQKVNNIFYIYNILYRKNLQMKIK